MELKRVPKLTKLLSDQQDSFFCVDEAEEMFLRSIQDGEHVVRRSLLEVDAQGQIIRADGPVGVYFDRKVTREELREKLIHIQNRKTETGRFVSMWKGRQKNEKETDE